MSVSGPIPAYLGLSGPIRAESILIGRQSLQTLSDIASCFGQFQPILVEILHHTQDQSGLGLV
jgi:hypothetical protein